MDNKIKNFSRVRIPIEDEAVRKKLADVVQRTGFIEGEIRLDTLEVQYAGVKQDSLEVNIPLPVMAVEHKKPGDTNAGVLNALRMHCASSVRWLMELGITDFPIFGLATVGSLGTVFVAWASERDGVCDRYSL